MRLEITEPRQAFIIRCQAWAYQNVLMGKYHKAQELFDERLEAFDRMVSDNPADDAGYWSGWYFDSFVNACRNKFLDQL